MGAVSQGPEDFNEKNPPSATRGSLLGSTAGQVCELGQITAFSPVPGRE